MTKSSVISGLGGICLMTICLALLQMAFGDQRICGPGLRQTLDIVCPNGFNGYKIKRNSMFPGDDYTDSNDEADSITFDFDMLPFLNSNEANSLAKIRRRRHGIVHECCDKPCTLNELKAYCRRPPYS